jgi:hypothetical protein
MSEQDKTNPNPEVPQDDKKGKEEPKATDAQKEQERIDKVVSERLKREREKYDKELAERLKKERDDWERQAKLSAEEREAEERKQREAQTAERERNIILRENRAEARELLQEKQIPANLVDFVVDVDPDKTKENISSLEEAFAKAVQKGIDDKLKGQTPKEKSNSTPPTIEKGTRIL